MNHYFSCDFGTSNTVVSYLNGDGVIDYIFDEMSGDILIPTTIYFIEENINENCLLSELEFNKHYVIGNNANENYNIYKNHNSYFYQFKRFLGMYKNSQNYDKDFINKYNIKYDIDDKLIYFFIPTNNNEIYIKISIIDLITLYLKAIHYLIKKTLTINNNYNINIFISTPAYFNDLQKNQLKTSFKNSNFNILKIYNEPTSASIYYITKFYKDIQEDTKFIIFDFGCGTLDITTINYFYEDKMIEIVDVYGNNSLGSVDIDHIIVNDIYLKYNIDVNNKKWNSKIINCAEEIKKKLTFNNNCKIILENVPLNINGVIVIKEFLEIIYNISYFNHLINDIVDKIIKPLKHIKENESNIKDIIFVGGGSLIPLIRNKAKSIFKIININENFLENDFLFKTIVSNGSCIMHKIINNKEDLCMIDITPMDIGLMSIDNKIINIIPKNSKIPTKKEYIFSTSFDGQTSIDFDICEMNNIAYSYYIKGIPPLRKGSVLIKILFQIDNNGLLNININGVMNGENMELSKKDFNLKKNIKLIPKYKINEILKKIYKKEIII
jgi:molecular chaperone DnaK (HSP70)